MRGQAAELGPRHPGFAQELLDPAYQHGSVSHGEGWFRPGESNRRNNPVLSGEILLV
jgi:hypothetical protein